MKTMKKAIAVSLIGAMLLPLAGCAKKIESVRARDFKTAIEEVIDEDDYTTNSDDSNVYYYGDDFFIDFYQLDDEDDAADAWEDILDSYNEMCDDKKFDGSRRMISTDAYGYILLNGESSDKHFLEDVANVYFLSGGKNFYYGGIFFVEDEIIVVMTTDDSNASRQDINTILNALGYPKP